MEETGHSRFEDDAVFESALDTTGEVVPQPSSLAWRTLKNSLYGIIEFGWPILVALVASPFIVNRLGPDAYGVLSVVGVTLGFFGVLDLGIGSAATRQIAAAHERDDGDEINRVVSTTLAFYLLIGTAGAVLMMALARVLATRLLKIPVGMQNVAVFAIYLSAIGFVVGLINSAFASIARALQRFDLATKLSLATSTINTVATVSVLALGEGLGWVVVTGFAVGVLAAPFSYLIAKRLLPGLRVSLRFDQKTFLELFSFGGFYLLSTVGVMLLYQADKVLIGSLIGVAAVTYYVVPGNLAGKIQGLVAAATAIVFPVSSALFESGRHESIERLYREGTRLVLIVATSIAVPMAVFAHPFLVHWMGPEVGSKSSTVMVLLVGTYYLLALTSTGWGITNAAGKAWVNAVFTLGIAAADISLFLALEGRYGVEGAAAAYLISACVGVPALIAFTERRVLQISGFAILGIGWRIWLVGFLQAVVSYFALPLASSLPATLLLMIGSVVLFFVFYVAFRFQRPGDQELLAMLIQRFRPKRLQEKE